MKLKFCRLIIYIKIANNKNILRIFYYIYNVSETPKTFGDQYCPYKSIKWEPSLLDYNNYLWEQGLSIT